jgi:hypothetical protein
MERKTVKPDVAVVVGLGLLTAVAVVAAVLFPLAAPVVAAVGAVACYLTRRRTQHPLITVLLVINLIAFAVAVVVDLFFLQAGEMFNPPR